MQSVSAKRCNRDDESDIRTVLDYAEPLECAVLSDLLVTKHYRVESSRAPLSHSFPLHYLSLGATVRPAAMRARALYEEIA